MEKEKISRISELSRKQRSEGLTPDEKREQELLRNEFRAEIRGNFEQQLDKCYIKNPDGTLRKVTK